MDSKRKHYKYCVVPKCKNTTVTTPDKIFITLPKNKKARTLWQKAMRRSDFLGSKTTKCCCEDHFNLEEDVENYMYFKLMKNVAIKLRPGVIPHIFDCQRQTVLDEPSGNAKKSRLSDNELSQNPECGSNNLENIKNNKVHKIDKNTKNKSIQVNIKPTLRSKAIQCRILNVPKKCKQMKLDSKKLPQISYSSNGSNTTESSSTFTMTPSESSLPEIFEQN